MPTCLRSAPEGNFPTHRRAITRALPKAITSLGHRNGAVTAAAAIVRTATFGSTAGGDSVNARQRSNGEHDR
jgi:hypothetical protein